MGVFLAVDCCESGAAKVHVEHVAIEFTKVFCLGDGHGWKESGWLPVRYVCSARCPQVTELMLDMQPPRPWPVHVSMERRGSNSLFSCPGSELKAFVPAVFDRHSTVMTLG